MASSRAFDLGDWNGMDLQQKYGFSNRSGYITLDARVVTKWTISYPTETCRCWRDSLRFAGAGTSRSSTCTLGYRDNVSGEQSLYAKLIRGNCSFSAARRLTHHHHHGTWVGLI